MSNFYVLEDSVASSSGVTKKYVDDQDKLLLDLKATRPLEDDLVLMNKIILGIEDIASSNSISSKGYIDGELNKKLNKSGGTVSGAINVPTPSANKHPTTKKYVDDNFVKKRGDTTMVGNFDMNLTYTMKRLRGPSDSGDATHKHYVDSKLSSQKTKLSTLMDTKIAAIPAPVQQEHHTYNLGLTAMSSQNSWVHFCFPTHPSPNGWMWCGGLNEKSYFVLLLHTFDSDNSFQSGSMTLQYKLEVFDDRGYLRRWEFLEDNAKSYRIPGELVIAWNIKKMWNDFPSGGGSDNYKTFQACRLSCRRKFSGTFGNESNCAFQIVI